MISDIEKEYTLLFYNENKVVATTNIVTTKESVKILGEVFVNAIGEYLPNKGNYNTVSWIENTNIDYILDRAIKQVRENKNKGDSNETDE